jgi:hypothetical protein
MQEEIGSQSLEELRPGVFLATYSGKIVKQLVEDNKAALEMIAANHPPNSLYVLINTLEANIVFPDAARSLGIPGLRQLMAGDSFKLVIVVTKLKLILQFVPAVIGADRLMVVKTMEEGLNILDSFLG